MDSIFKYNVYKYVKQNVIVYSIKFENITITFEQKTCMLYNKW